MTHEYNEIRDEARTRGCVTARLFIRYPIKTGNKNLDFLFKSEAEGFRKFVSNKVFPKKENELLTYIENGGRRSLFPVSELKLDITVTGTHKSLISVRTEAYVAEQGKTRAYKLYHEVFDTESGILCRERDIVNRVPRKKHEGFYLKDGKMMLYSDLKHSPPPLKAADIRRLPVTVLSVDL